MMRRDTRGKVLAFVFLCIRCRFQGKGIKESMAVMRQRTGSGLSLIDKCHRASPECKRG